MCKLWIKILKMRLTAVEKLDPAATVEKYQHDTLKWKRREKTRETWSFFDSSMVTYAAGISRQYNAYFKTLR